MGCQAGAHSLPTSPTTKTFDKGIGSGRQAGVVRRAQGALLDEREAQPGVLLALVTLLLGLVSRSYEGYEALAPRVVRLLERLVPDRRESSAREAAPSVAADYHYYGIPSPWLQACLRRRCSRCATLGPDGDVRATRRRSSACACYSTSRRRKTRRCCAR